MKTKLLRTGHHRKQHPAVVRGRSTQISQMTQRNTVLRLYRRAMRIARNWHVPHEREYIRDESRRLLRMNQNLQSPSVIAEKIAEFNTRIETALHYKIPYPRPVNVAPGATGKRPGTVMPIYLHSYQQAHAASEGGSRWPIKAPEYED